MYLDRCSLLRLLACTPAPPFDSPDLTLSPAGVDDVLNGEEIIFMLIDFAVREGRHLVNGRVLGHEGSSQHRKVQLS